MRIRCQGDMFIGRNLATAIYFGSTVPVFQLPCHIIVLRVLNFGFLDIRLMKSPPEAQNLIVDQLLRKDSHLHAIKMYSVLCFIFKQYLNISRSNKT
jgi:hypothetical protein